MSNQKDEINGLSLKNLNLHLKSHKVASHEIWDTNKYNVVTGGAYWAISILFPSHNVLNISSSSYVSW